MTNGVILFRRDYAPELWNFDLTQCLERFHEIAHYSRCLPVSEEVIALWNSGKQRIIFFNVLSKTLEFDMTLTDPIYDMYVCSIKHHVLASVIGRCVLWKDGRKVDALEDMLRQFWPLRVERSQFSPDGSKLALSKGVFFTNVFIFDVVLFTLLAEVLLTDLAVIGTNLTFFDNEYLVCGSENHILYLANARNGDILTYLDCGFVPNPLCVCRQRSIICVSRDTTENVELVKVRLPRTS